ncbi:hypothetical protein ACQUFI_00005, partial [Enterococcus casseliflavus]
IIGNPSLNHRYRKGFYSLFKTLQQNRIALLAGIDWFSGMFRTLLNVDPDVTVALIVAHDEGELDHAVFNGEKVSVKLAEKITDGV